MKRPTLTLLILSSVLILTACQTTKLSVNAKAVCAALERADTLPSLTDEERSVIASSFSRETKDRLKTPRAIMQELGC